MPILGVMPWEAWYTLGLVVLLMTALVSGRIGTDTAMLGTLTLLMVAGVVEPTDAIAGFADPSVLMIAGLFIVASGLTSTGATAMIANKILGRPESLPAAQFRLMAPVTGMSAFMNNTPIVAMYLPIVHSYAKRLGISPSKLFMPLSFAAILGGSCTLIGTATNVAINELYIEHFAANESELTAIGLSMPSNARQFWGIAVVGIPSALVGLFFIAFASGRLLPARTSPDDPGADARQYTTRVIVEPAGPIVGKTIGQAGLRQLPGLFLFAIERDGNQIPAVAPDTVLEPGDELVFTGVVESVVDLLKTKGLAPAEDQAAEGRRAHAATAPSLKPLSRTPRRWSADPSATPHSAPGSTPRSSPSTAAGSASRARSATSSSSPATRSCSRPTPSSSAPSATPASSTSSPTSPAPGKSGTNAPGSRSPSWPCSWPC